MFLPWKKIYLIAFVTATTINILLIFFKLLDPAIKSVLSLDLLIATNLLLFFIVFYYYREQWALFITLNIHSKKIKILIRLILVLIILYILLGELISHWTTTVPYLNIFNKSSLSNPYLLLILMIISMIIFFIDRNLINKALLNSKSLAHIEKNYSKNKSSKKLLPISALLIIIILSLLLRSTYIYDRFWNTNEHRTKYASYVTTSLEMAKTKNPIHIIKKYYSDSFTRPDNKVSSIYQLPILEWGLMATYMIPGSIENIEFSTRIFMYILEILLIIAAYLFLKSWLTIKQSLIVTGIFAINPTVILATYITVYDAILMLFTFISFIFINKFKNTNNKKYLFISGLILGLGVISKYNILLWALPIITYLLYKMSNSKAKFIVNTISVYIVSTMPLVTFNLSLKYLPIRPLISILLVIPWIIIYWLTYKIIINGRETSISIAKYYIKLVTKRKIILLLTIIICYLLVKTVFYVMKMPQYFTGEFLTDYKLLLNLSLYKYMLFSEFKPAMGYVLFNLGLVGLMISPYLKNKKQKIITIAFLIGVVFYWVLASKVIFFHSYYTLVIIFAFAIMISNLFSFFEYRYPKIHTIIVIIAFAALFTNSYYNLKSRLHIERPYVPEVIEYIQNNINENEYFLDDTNSPTLTIYTNASRVDKSVFYNQAIKNAIQKQGFAKTMEKYNIKYLLTYSEPDYLKWVNIFTDQKLENNITNRTKIILSIIYNKSRFDDILQRNIEIKKNNLIDRFILEKEIGYYKIYSFN